ncbi:uncharacterized protein LOC128985377 [Macrosteles quadrilineatus]|uniref:uncharacterized protein LOC128985377 n=1 Tax=Macrosteles quadrilineatus TaxID=74068 RepID=UPI0023E1EE1C|nr:uncharacterized protein LOC128985377 [Macrosteles quadrilineatus]
MDHKEFVKQMQDTHKQLIDEDKQVTSQLADMEAKFDTENKLTTSDFNEIYGESVKNFRLDFGTVCEKGRDEILKELPKAKRLCQKKKIAQEYLTCVEMTRLKAAQRAQQN